PGSGGALLDQLTAVGDRLFFVADTTATGSELWRADTNGAALVADIQTATDSANPTFLAAIGDQLYFRACALATGCEMWRTDGIATSLVADVAPGAAASGWPHWFT